MTLFTHSETVKDLIYPVQKVLHNRDGFKNKFKPEDLKGVKTILQEWKKNKNHFYYDFFNEHTIADFGEVSIHLGDEEKGALVKEFIKKIQEDWDNLFPNFDYYDNEISDFCDFLAANKEQIFNNKTYEDWEAPDGTIISAGSKISKSFKHFFSESELIRQLQDKFSHLIQQDKMTGILCASIHPLDYLSLSENNYKWRSCHALNGDYAGGNASYMMDNCTIVFYLKGADDVKLPRFPEDVLWNDKKWRMLMFIHPDNKIMWAGRQYPFFSQDLLAMCWNAIAQLNGNKFLPWSHEYLDRFMMPSSLDEKSLKDLYIYHSGCLMTRGQLIKDAPRAAHYNDLLHSSFYVPYYSFNNLETIVSDNYPEIEVGHISICAMCGEKHTQATEDFLCANCKNKVDPPLCNCCHKPIYQISEINWYAGLGCVCKQCEEKYTIKCSCCGYRHAINQPCTNREFNNVSLNHYGFPIGDILNW